MSNSFSFLVTAAAWALSTIGTAYAQQTITPLPGKASLVLTPEFCDTELPQQFKVRRGHFAVGKAACANLEPALKAAISNLTVINALPTPGSTDAQLILLPRFIDGAIVIDYAPATIRRMDVLLEWTVKDSSGKTLWLETVHGLATHDPWAKRKDGEEAPSLQGLFKTLIETSVKDAAVQSASKMSAAPELRKAAQSH